MWRLLALSSFTLGFWGCPVLADGPPGVLPTSRLPEGYPLVGRISHKRSGDVLETLSGNVPASMAETGGENDGRFTPMHAMQDLLRFRQSSADGLIEFQYMLYLTHALLLSNVEATAHDIQRMPLHRFSSPLSPDQVAEIPLGSVGGPRPYHMFVLFTLIEGRTEGIAQDLSDKCRDCAAALAAFRGVSKAYKLSDSSPGSEDALPAFFAVVNIGTRDGAGISAIHPAMQIPIVMHLPPTASRGFCSTKKNQNPSCSAEAAEFASARISKESLNAARYQIANAEFFGGALGDGWDEERKLRELLQQHKRDNVHGKIHFFSPAESQLFLLQRFKNEAPPEQRLLDWANARTKRQVNYAFEDRQAPGQTKRSVLLLLLPLFLLLAWWLFLKGLSLLRRNRWIVPVGGVLAYTLCSGGLIFSIIHSVPFAGYDEVNMRYVLLAPTSRAQFMLEGLFLSCCSTVASLAALFLVQSPVSRENTSCSPVSNIEGSVGTTQNCQEMVGSRQLSEVDAFWRRHLAAASFAVTALIFVLCSGFVMQCYRTKAAWYAPDFWPSPMLPKGPLKVDWGNAF